MLLPPDIGASPSSCGSVTPPPEDHPCPPVPPGISPRACSSPYNPADPAVYHGLTACWVWLNMFCWVEAAMRDAWICASDAAPEAPELMTEPSTDPAAATPAPIAKAIFGYPTMRI